MAITENTPIAEEPEPRTEPSLLILNHGSKGGDQLMKETWLVCRVKRDHKEPGI